MSTSNTLSFLGSRLAELSAEILHLEQRLDLLKKERNAIAHASEALESLQGDVLSDAIDDVGDGSLTYRQRMVLTKVPFGKNNALSPSVIGKACPTLEPGYVRTTLRRLSEAGTINSHEGVYWRVLRK